MYGVGGSTRDSQVSRARARARAPVDLRLKRGEVARQTRARRGVAPSGVI